MARPNSIVSPNNCSTNTNGNPTDYGSPSPPLTDFSFGALTGHLLHRLTRVKGVVTSCRWNLPFCEWTVRGHKHQPSIARINTRVPSHLNLLPRSRHLQKDHSSQKTPITPSPVTCKTYWWIFPCIKQQSDLLVWPSFAAS